MATSGILRMTVVEARLKTDHNLFTTQDPYVMFENRFQRHKTKVSYDGGREPKFNETFDLDVKYIGDDFTMRIYSKNSVMADTLIGRSTIKISSLCIPGGIDDWWVVCLNDEDAGAIHFKGEWIPAQVGNDADKAEIEALKKQLELAKMQQNNAQQAHLDAQAQMQANLQRQQQQMQAQLKNQQNIFNQQQIQQLSPKNPQLLFQDKERTKVDIGNDQRLYVPKTVEEVHKFTLNSEKSSKAPIKIKVDKPVQSPSGLLRESEMQGSDNQDQSLRGKISCYPEMNYLNSLSKDQLRQHQITRIQHREWCNNGIFEGLIMHLQNGQQSEPYGECRRHPWHVDTNLPEKIDRIVIYYDERWVTAITFIDNKEQETTLGKKEGGGKTGRVLFRRVGVKSSEILVGIKIQESPDPVHKPGQKIGWIGFIFHDTAATSKDQEFKIITTDMCGPPTDSQNKMRDQIYFVPKDLQQFSKYKLDQLKQQEIKCIGWREFYNHGIMEGLDFTQCNGVESDKFGSSKLFPRQHTLQLLSKGQVKKIVVFYDDRYVTGMSFFDKNGQKIQEDVGKPTGNGIQGKVNEQVINLEDGDMIVGVKIQESHYGGEEWLIGRVGFALCRPGKMKGQAPVAMESVNLELRETEMCGPGQDTKSQMRQEVYSYPKVTQSLAKCNWDQLQGKALQSIGWREYFNNGIVEGLDFKLFNGEQSEMFASSKLHPRQFTLNIQSPEQVRKIIVFYDDRYVTGMSFFDQNGSKIQEDVGKPRGNGVVGQVREKVITLDHGDMIVGVKVQEALYSGNEYLVGRVGFLICGKPQNRGQIIAPPKILDQELRVTDFIGPSSGKLRRDKVYSFPENVQSLITLPWDQLQKKIIKNIGYRLWYDKGVFEGLTLTNVGGESESFGESKRFENPLQANLDSNKIKKISVFYDDKWVIGLAFYDFKGQRIGDIVGNVKGGGATGQVIEEFIGLHPDEKILGIKMQEAADPADDNAMMIGRISFILCGPPAHKGEYRWSYAGQSVSYDTHFKYVEQMGGQLPTFDEALKLIRETGVLFPGEDQWAACSKPEEDWVQLGNTPHVPGKSHVQHCGGKPGWSRSTNVFPWRNVFLWKQLPQTQNQSNTQQTTVIRQQSMHFGFHNPVSPIQIGMPVVPNPLAPINQGKHVDPIFPNTIQTEDTGPCNEPPIQGKFKALHLKGSSSKPDQFNPLTHNEYTVFGPLSGGEIRVGIRWRDQGQGSRQGELRLELLRNHGVIGHQKMFNGTAPHNENTQFQIIKPEKSDLMKMAKDGDRLRWAVKVGDADHQLHIEAFGFAIYYDQNYDDPRPNHLNQFAEGKSSACCTIF